MLLSGLGDVFTAALIAAMKRRCASCSPYWSLALEDAMIPSPFRFENNLSAEDFQKIGQLSLRWSHTEHIVANCLKRLLRLTEDEAVLIVFPLNLDRRMQQIKELGELALLPTDATHAFAELRWAMQLLAPIRNTVAHALLLDDATGNQVFHLRSKGRSVTKAQIFEIEELTNYAAHAALDSYLAIL
jgi:hypothetical protein